MRLPTAVFPLIAAFAWATAAVASPPVVFRVSTRSNPAKPAMLFAMRLDRKFGPRVAIGGRTPCKARRCRQSLQTPSSPWPFRCKCSRHPTMAPRLG